MRLRKIRLAGFKSFVDPTTIELPGNVVGVVGPNGGGKSNVIDAVRWVMGEISARSLRGATMADVVFNGSSSRKPVSGASVELVFDNLEGRAGGRFAAFNEISIRRQLTRDGQSTYWLNGTRCRRRDVMDVFHGTGLGPRSYAIIEQGMISRIIEAKPDDLRDFLEEAAGISKYKERRRETENRMRHTVENLDRLNDLREELARRLAHLKRQAALAEKFRELKAAQRALEAEHLALQWRVHDEEAGRRAGLVAEQETRLEAVLAGQRRIEADLEHARATHAEATESYNRRYRDVSGAEADIARIEESIRSLRRRGEDLTGSLAQETERLQATSRQIDQERARSEELARQIARDEPAMEELRKREAGAQGELRAVEEDFNALQAELESLIDREREPAQAVHAERMRIQHLESTIEELETRARSLEEERGAIDPDSNERGTEPLRRRIESMERELESAEVEQSRSHETVQGLRESVRAAALALNDVRERLGKHRGRAASLEALQQEALGAVSGVPPAWLEARGLAAAPRLAQSMRAAPGWEHAVEAVLGVRLQAVLSDAFDLVAADSAALEQGTLTAVDARAVEPAAAGGTHGLDSLGSKVETHWPIAGLLEGVLCVSSLDEGLAFRSQLSAGESVITRDGVWIGPTWLHVRRVAGEEYGVLERERAIEALARETERAGAEEASSAHTLESLSGELRAAEDALSAAQGTLSDGHRRCTALRTELAARDAEADQASRRAAALDTEIADLSARTEFGRERLADACDQLRHATHELERLSGERSECDAKRRARRDGLASARERWQGLRDEAHALELRVQALRSRLTATEEAIERDRRRLEELEQHHKSLEDSLAELEAPLAQARADLDRKLVRRTSLESDLAEARAEAERVEAVMRETDEARQRKVAEVDGERETLERLRVESQETLVLRRTVQERLDAAGERLDALLQRIGADADPADWAEKLEAMERRIARLGSINLAAIDEHEQQSERKRYLDAQHADLEEALATLNAAIQRIDRETRTRFRETYERVNQHLGTTFPRLFAGGSAALQLTSDDILGAGVTVMARPPGKRNTSINLLSGGEKALTAIALIFAIFELNPAPFCLLDEVDAPLDDTNIGRFCELVEEMAQRVQLVLVTHNKITMEIAGQLIGITMSEPGVSRLVAVDVEEAVEMAQA